MTDGGQDVLDPRYLSRSKTPSVIVTEDGTTNFVANATLKDNGWIYVIRWDCSRALIPPHIIVRVERVDTQRTTKNDTATHAIVDDDLRERARRLAQPTETEAEANQEAVADD
jgi:hypothetical protein